MIKRGIITPSAIQSYTDDTLTIHRNFDLEDMYYFAMYWDKISIPTNSMLHIDVPNEDDFLSNGILERPSSMSGGYINLVEMEKLNLLSFCEAAKEKLKDSSMHWTIHHLSENPTYVPQHVLEQDLIRLKITDALPIPADTGEYNLHDLLNFKLKRNDELIALHSSMDELLKKIYSEEIESIRLSELKRFELAVKELSKTTLERFKIIKKSDWEVSLKPAGALLDFGKNIATGLFADAKTGQHFPYFTTAFGLTSLFSLTKKLGVTFNQYAKSDLKLEYISSARTERILA